VCAAVLTREGLAFERGRSPAGAAVLAGVHLVVLLAWWMVSAWLPGTLAVTALIALSLAWELRRARARVRVRLDFGADGTPEVSVESSDGTRLAGALERSTFVSPWLVMLRFRVPGSRRCASLPVVRDAVGRSVHRRLRIWLHWAAGPALGGGMREVNQISPGRSMAQTMTSTRFRIGSAGGILRACRATSFARFLLLQRPTRTRPHERP